MRRVVLRAPLRRRGAAFLVLLRAPLRAPLRRDVFLRVAFLRVAFLRVAFLRVVFRRVVLRGAALRVAFLRVLRFGAACAGAAFFFLRLTAIGRGIILSLVTSDQGCCLPYTVLRGLMQVFADDGTRVDAHVDGVQGTHAVVLIHGFPLSRAIWDSQRTPLARKHFVITPDLRGFGKSGVPEGPYLMETLASDVAVLLDALGVRRASLAGHSMGGYVALAFARMFSERVARLALVPSRLGADSSEQSAARRALADVAERERSIEPVIGAYVPRLLAPDTPAQAPEVAQRAYELARGTSPRGAAAALRGMALRASSEDIAGDLDVPVLMLADRKSVV